MRIEQSYPSPIHGVSTLAPRSRPQGYASRQVNFRSDPVNKLTRRPSSQFRTPLGPVTDVNNVKYHSYARDGKEYSYLVDKVAGEIHCLIDDVVQKTLPLGAYSGNNIELYTVEHDTYILNKDIVTALSTKTDESSVQRVTHVNVTAALNYSETVKLFITKPDGSRAAVSYTVPEIGIEKPNYDAADKSRATSQVAFELARLINDGSWVDSRYINPDYAPTDDVCYRQFNFEKNSGTLHCDIYYERSSNPLYNPTDITCVPYLNTSGLTGVTAVALGSTVAIWDSNARTEWLQVEIESGQGDRTTVAVNQVIEKTDGLPLYAVVGTRITVRPDPTSDKGIYYLQAERIADDPSGEDLEEVVWSEDRSPVEPYELDSSTMPHLIKFENNDFTYGEILWDERKSGDNISVKAPKFIGFKLQTMGYFQKRLVVVAENGVYMTETDETTNWWKQSAVQLLVSDPIGITTSELSADKILYLVPHNRDLLAFTRNSQFKIDGSTAITPQTVSMPLTTKYEVQESVPPVPMGNSVYFPIDYGSSTGFQEYTGKENTTQDFASPITNHIIGMLDGEAELITVSPNLEMIALTTSSSNSLFIYEQYTESGGKRTQQSWSEWVFAGNETIVDIKFRKNELIIIMARDNELFVKAIAMYTRVSASGLDVFLDDFVELPTGGLEATVPVGYDTTDMIAIRGEGTTSQLWPVKFTIVNDKIVFNEDIGVGQIYIGKKYTSIYEPTRPFKYDEDGSTINTDRLRVGKWILSLVETHELTMTKESDYVDPVEVVFESRFVGRYKVGSIQAYTGDWPFSFNDNASLATASFSTSSYLGCTISDISWEGQYYQSKKRM